MTNANMVTFGKPKVGGAIYSAGVDAALPTDAVTKLDASFVDLGYVSEDGVTNENTPETENVIAWGGDVVLTTQTSKEDTFAFTLIEALNVEVLKEVYGKDNVSGDITKGITVKANSKPPEPHALVIDMIAKGGVIKRIVIPNATVSEVGEIAYNDADPVGYETTLSCSPDAEGNTHYEYIIKSSTTEETTTGTDTGGTA